MYVDRCMYSILVYVCVWVYTYVSMCTCECVRVYLCLCVCWFRVVAFQTRSCDLNSVTGDTDSCSQRTRYTGDSKTDPWDDPEMCTGSCSEDQTTIRFQNRVISCECLLLYQFLIYHCQYCLYVICIISCDRLIYLTSMIIRTISVSEHFYYTVYLNAYQHHSCDGWLFLLIQDELRYILYCDLI